MFWCSFFFFKHKTAYEMRISDWSSDVCSSDLQPKHGQAFGDRGLAQEIRKSSAQCVEAALPAHGGKGGHAACRRSEEHTSELQSLMRISYAVFCLKKKKNNKQKRTYTAKKLHSHN